MMLTLLLSALLAAQAPAAAPEEIRAIVATITDEKGGAVTPGLDPDEVAIVENGVARDLVSIDLDERPMTLAFIVDTSEATASALRLNLVAAAASFLKGLPEGSTFAIWTTGDRPTKVARLHERPRRSPEGTRAALPPRRQHPARRAGGGLGRPQARRKASARRWWPSPASTSTSAIATAGARSRRPRRRPTSSWP